jgi:hypothetical protein
LTAADRVGKTKGKCDKQEPPSHNLYDYLKIGKYEKIGKINLERMTYGEFLIMVH